MTNREDPPQRDELEISIIGPGRGESVIVHLGDNEWCVVDSCLARDTRQPVALEYLRGFGNRAEENIKLIIATHWHDDHIQGLSSLLASTPNAHFGCSAALDTLNFATLVEVAKESTQGGSGVDEFKTILDILKARGETAGIPQHLVSPSLAIENRCLIMLPSDGRSFQASVTALSPSDGTVKRAFSDIAIWLPRAGDAQRRIPNQSPNKTSVALWIVAGDRRALLGADLEHTANEGEGWRAVLASRQDVNAANIFKVPHHGSRNADCPEVWTQLLYENPISIVTPFTSGTGLPRASDLRRLAGRTSHLYCTVQGPGRPPRRDSAVERLAKNTVRSRRVLQGHPGHVRVRWSASNEAAKPTIDLFNGAYQIR